MYILFVPYAVDINVKKPLQPTHLSSEQVAVEIWSLCFQLDLLIRAEVHQLQEQLREDKSPVESESFHTRGIDYVERIKHYLEHLPDPVPQLEDYLDSQGLSTLFPRVEIYVIHGRPVDMLERPTTDVLTAPWFSIAFASKMALFVVIVKNNGDFQFRLFFPHWETKSTFGFKSTAGR